jgi:hypothetical protein
MLAALSLALFAAAAAVPQGPVSVQSHAQIQVRGPTATVSGQVRSEGLSTPLRGAVVQIVSSGVTLQATTDSAGTYILRGVPLGRRMLRASHFDHAPLEVEIVVSDRMEIVLDFALEIRPVKLPAITARAVISNMDGDTLAAGAAALGQASVKALESSPGIAEIGLAEVAREMPGPEPDPTDVLYVRGGTTDLKLVLLNGAPVYAPFHLGGLINPLDGDLMRAAHLYVGGAPARYDGGLSYVMDLETRAGRNSQSHASLGFDFLSSRTILEGPLTNSSTYLVAARAVHGMGARAFVSNNRFPYSYADGITRLDFDFVGGRVTLSGFWNYESVLLDSLAGGRATAAWGNTAGSARYRGTVFGADAEVTIAGGRFHTQLPVGTARPIVTQGSADRVRMSAHFAKRYGQVNMQYGATLDDQQYEYRAWPRTGSRDSLLLRAVASGDIAGFYVDGQWQPLKRLTVRTGLRTDIFSLDNAARVAPRVSASYMLTDKASLTVAAGRYRQYVRSETSSGIIGTPLPDSVGAPPLAIAKASHLVLGLDQDLGDGVRVAVEGYYKAFEDLPSTEGELTESSGLDLWVRRGIGRLTGWVGYSLGWVWSLDETTSNTTVFAGRQLLSAGASGSIGANGKFDLRIAYGAGLPFTAIPEPEAAPPVFGVGFKPSGPSASVPDENLAYPTPPDEQYLRLDAQIAHTFITDVRGFAFELTPYFKVLNALDRRDALFYHFDRSQQEPQARAVAALPVLPIVGFEWRF